MNKKKKEAEEKFQKILIVQNKQIDINNRKSEKADKSELLSENEYLKNELLRVRSARL